MAKHTIEYKLRTQGYIILFFRGSHSVWWKGWCLMPVYKINYAWGHSRSPWHKTHMQGESYSMWVLPHAQRKTLGTLVLLKSFVLSTEQKLTLSANHSTTINFSWNNKFVRPIGTLISLQITHITCQHAQNSINKVYIEKPQF